MSGAHWRIVSFETGRANSWRRPADGAAEDRNTAAARRADNRLVATGDSGDRTIATGRCRLCAPAGRFAAFLRDQPDQFANPRHHPQRTRPLAVVQRRYRRAGTALLSIDRGQDLSLRRSRRASGFLGAGGSRQSSGLPQWHLDFATDRYPGRNGRSMAGLEQCEIAIPGYAVEYDHIDPRTLDSTLAVRGLKAYIARARSTARPAMRRRRRRGWSQA